MDTGRHPAQENPRLLAHERTYKAFNILLRWSMVATASSMLFFTLWFATRAGFLGGLVAGLVAFWAGYRFLVRHEMRQPLDPWASGR